MPQNQIHMKKRMTNIKYSLLLAAVSLLLSSCLDGKACEDMPFDEFVKADRVEITNNMNEPLRKISKRAEINKLAAFAKLHKSGWRTPFSDTPIALVGAKFYRGEEFLGDFGIGSSFLTAQGCGYFQSRSVSPDDRATIMKLFAVKDPYENYK